MDWSRTAIALTITLCIAFSPMPSFGAKEKPESNTGKTSPAADDELKELIETEVAKWYRKAAEQGNANAQFLLGAMYENGTGTMMSKHTAADWYYKAGLSYLKKGNKEQALVMLDRIEANVPDHFLAKKLMEEIYGNE